MKNFLKLIQISRPRFWFYLAGPLLIGFISATPGYHYFFSTQFLFSFLYFLLPANIFIYGVNDLFDQDTDSLNQKKTTHEHRFAYNERTLLITAVLISLVLGGIYFFYLKTVLAQLILLLFFLISTAYSAPPIRFKMRPFWDSFSNVLYILPGILVYTEITTTLPPLFIVCSGWLWCSAMHLFSAIPDIIPDKKAGLRTSAVILGEEKSIKLCLLLWMVSACTILYILPQKISAILFIYPILMLMLIQKKIDIASFYWWFPWINTVVGMIGFFAIYLKRFGV